MSNASPGVPPRRLSADPDHRDYHPWWSHNAVVLLNGKPIKRVLQVDTDAGLAIVVCFPFRLVRGEPEREVIEGNFEIRANAEAEV